jgi:hypothetical protein
MRTNTWIACCDRSVGIVQGWRIYGTCAQNGMRKISLARDPPCCLIVLFLLPDQRLCIVKNMCIYTHIWLHRDCLRITITTK